MTQPPIPSGACLGTPSQPDLCMFLSFFLCSWKFLNPKRERRNFSAALWLLPWCNQRKTKPTTNNPLVLWKCYKTEAGCCWETLYSLLFCHLTPLSRDTRNMLLQLLWKAIVSITTQGTQLQPWGTVRGCHLPLLADTLQELRSFVCLIFPLVGKQTQEQLQLLQWHTLWDALLFGSLVITSENKKFSVLAPALSLTSSRNC